MLFQMLTHLSKRQPNAAFLFERTGGALIGLVVFRRIWANVDKDRRNVAKNLAKEIERAQFHKLYLPDFWILPAPDRERLLLLRPPSRRISQKTPAVNRIQAQKQLNELHISPQDLEKPEMLAKATEALGADAPLVGTATATLTDANLLLSLRDATSSKEVRSMAYHEKLQPVFKTRFPAVPDQDNHAYDFAGFDDVLPPKCTHSPNPDFSDEATRRRIEATVWWSVPSRNGVSEPRGIQKDTPSRDGSR